MTADAAALAARVTRDTGLEFVGSGVGLGRRSYQLTPAHHPPANTFSLDVSVGWRRVEVELTPGRFAGDLVNAMGSVEASGRELFVSILMACAEEGAQVAWLVNGMPYEVGDPQAWEKPWGSISLSVRKGMLPLGDHDGNDDEDLIGVWVSRVAAAVLALLPLEGGDGDVDAGTELYAEGLPEGALSTMNVNRYERSRRNRAAAIAIHGSACKVCEIRLEERYGPIAAGRVDVHHTTPVSQLGPNYVVDPAVDLVPLCPNCHAVAHLRTPPFSVGELRALFVSPESVLS